MTTMTTPEPLTEARLAAIEARCQAATPGPWKVAFSSLAVFPTIHAPEPLRPLHEPSRTSRRSPFSPAGFVAVAGTRASTLIDYEERVANAEYMAHARADVPDLVAEVRRLRRIERLLQATEGYPEVLRTAPRR